MNASRILGAAAIGIACFVATLALSSNAHAYGYGGYDAGYSGPGYYGSGHHYYSPYRHFPLHPYHTPYFAYHPPVYYSGIVKRTYGTSPFPQWPTSKQVVIVAAPQRIVNPYATGDGTSESQATKPQIIYPMAEFANSAAE